jgi:hypothetical protein
MSKIIENDIFFCVSRQKYAVGDIGVEESNNNYYTANKRIFRK